MDGYEEEWTDLQKVYNNHIEFSHKNTGEKMKIKDKQPILDAGYQLETRHMCKLCKQLQTKQNCGSHLHKNNKVDKVFIQNMQIIKIPGPAFGSASTKP
jgi:lysine/ornithine N-monooxygenase